MIFPLDKYVVTQGFYPVAIDGHPFHGGLDLAAPKGTPIKSPVTGTVISVGTNPKYLGGLYVIVREDDPEGLEYYMGHQSQTEVVKGQRVSEGQEVGKVGATGNATGPHVHFQIREKNAGALQDPNEVLKRKGGNDMVNDGDTTNYFLALFDRQPTQAELDKNRGKEWNIPDPKLRAPLYDDMIGRGRYLTEENKRLQKLVDDSGAQYEPIQAFKQKGTTL